MTKVSPASAASVNEQSGLMADQSSLAPQAQEAVAWAAVAAVFAGCRVLSVGSSLCSLMQLTNVFQRATHIALMRTAVQMSWLGSGIRRPLALLRRFTSTMT